MKYFKKIHITNILYKINSNFLNINSVNISYNIIVKLCNRRKNKMLKN